MAGSLNLPVPAQRAVERNRNSVDAVRAQNQLYKDNLMARMGWQPNPQAAPVTNNYYSGGQDMYGYGGSQYQPGSSRGGYGGYQQPQQQNPYGGGMGGYGNGPGVGGFGQNMGGMFGQMPNPYMMGNYGMGGMFGGMNPYMAGMGGYGGMGGMGPYSGYGAMYGGMNPMMAMIQRYQQMLGQRGPGGGNGIPQQGGWQSGIGGWNNGGGIRPMPGNGGTTTGPEEGRPTMMPGRTIPNYYSAPGGQNQPYPGY